MADKIIQPTLAETACRAVGKRVAYNSPTNGNNTAISIFESKDGRTGVLFENFDKELKTTTYQCGIDGKNPKAYFNNKDETDSHDPELLRNIVQSTKKTYGNSLRAKASRAIFEIVDAAVGYKAPFKPTTAKE